MVICHHEAVNFGSQMWLVDVSDLVCRDIRFGKDWNTYT